MMNFQHPDLRLYALSLHMRELRAQADSDRRARLVRGPRPLRRHIGRLLVAFGQALQGAPATAPEAEDAPAYKRLAA